MSRPTRPTYPSVESSVAAAASRASLYTQGPKHTCGRPVELVSEDGQLVEICGPCRHRRVVPRRRPTAEERGVAEAPLRSAKHGRLKRGPYGTINRKSA